MKSCTSLPNDLEGFSFSTEQGLTFTVVKGQYFHQKDIATQHNRYLSGLREGLIVSVSFYGQPVSLITVNEGVVRLIEINMNGKIVLGSLEISRVLKLTQTRLPVALLLF